MNPEITVRPAAEKDYEAIVELRKVDDANYHREYPRFIKEPSDAPIRRGTFLNSLDGEEPEWCFFVAELDSTIAGFIEVAFTEEKGNRVLRDNQKATVDDLIVDERYRRKGVATALMRQAEAWAREQGADNIELTVYDSRSNAIGLYEKLGYNVITHEYTKELT